MLISQHAVVQTREDDLGGISEQSDRPATHPAHAILHVPEHMFCPRPLYCCAGQTEEVATEDSEFVYRRAEGGLTGWIDCYGKSALKGHIFCGGVGGPNEIAGDTKLQEAYEMGKKV